jgi:hypothetical protein
MQNQNISVQRMHVESVLLLECTSIVLFRPFRIPAERLFKQIFTKFCTEQFYEILSNHFGFNLYRTLLSTTLHADLHVFLHSGHLILVE